MVLLRLRKLKLKVESNGPGDKVGYLLDFYIVPINERYYSVSVAIVPIIGYTTV